MSDMHNNFSVLMSVYHATIPAQLSDALQSVANQTLPPDEIVIVKDGPLKIETDEVIADWQRKKPALFKIITLTENCGLGYALQKGLEKCSFDIIARMDDDDISCPDRFKKQLRFLRQNPEISLVSSWMACFENDPDNILFIRRAPVTSEEIAKIAKFRNSINHAPSVFYRSKVLEAGGYRNWPGFEDYHLFARMLLNNTKMACIPEALYKVRYNGVLRRRHGLKRICLIMRLQKEFLNMGFISLPYFLINIVTRTLACIMPISMVRFIRTRLLKL